MTTTTTTPTLPNIDLSQLEVLVTAVDAILTQPAFTAIFPQAMALHALNPVLKGVLDLGIQLQAQNGTANVSGLLQPILSGVANVASLLHLPVPNLSVPTVKTS